MNFEKYAQESNKFLKEVSDELQTREDTDHAYRVLRSVFHTLRDILTSEESMHMISQLPMYLKALYVDGWNMQGKKRIRSMEEFLKCLRSKDDRAAARDFGDDARAKAEVKAVFNVLQRHITTGEIVHIMDQFPGELVELWNRKCLRES